MSEIIDDVAFCAQYAGRPGQPRYSFCAIDPRWIRRELQSEDERSRVF